MAPLYDAHCHYHDAWLTPHRERVFTDLGSVGVRAAIVNGSSESDWADVAQLPSATTQLVLRPSFGLHPWDVGNRSAAWQQNLLAALAATPGAAIGEIGLDRWMLDRARPDDPRLAGLRRAPIEEQIEVFRWQLALAAERNLPASIHCLDAFGPILDVLSSTPLPARGFLLHAYSGSIEMMHRFAELGGYFSFNGAFLEPRKARLREMFAAVHLDRLLVETDAPAMRLPADRERFTLPPTPDGDLPHHPANIAVTYAALADLRGLPLEQLTAAVAENFERLFSLD